METRARPQQLAYPFAIVGAAAGWLASDFLSNPLVDITTGGSALTAALCAGVVGALLGVALTRIGVAQRDRDTRGRIALRVSGAVIGGGAVAGGLAVALQGAGFHYGVIEGALSAIAFVPICLLVVAAARRAERARHGSIVARADRREVWAVLAGTMSIATLAALPAWITARLGIVFIPPIVPLAMAFAAGALTLIVLAIDAVAFFRVRKLCRATSLEERTKNIAEDQAAARRIDLGLGDGLQAHVSKPTVGYRAREKADMLLIGDPAEAQSALARALVRGAAGIIVTAAVLSAHGFAAVSPVAHDFLARHCPSGRVECASLQQAW